MKKLLVLWLLLSLPLCALGQGLVEFEGETVAFGGYGFSLRLPEGWLEVDMMEAYGVRDISFMDESLAALLYRMYMGGETEQVINVMVVPFEDTEDNWRIAETFEKYFGEFGAWEELDGARAFRFSDYGMDTCGAFILGDGIMIAITGQPLEDLEFAALLSKVIGSFAFVEESHAETD